ncbi:hypothetical protein SteCoe_4906 [Stentor coeruleus]|uniref:F-box domain-containing protein n=1 Tax=Stentor coeruleus TaxID=5963 RepID=A0A1R2CTQ5_9CILI|nr:hypothetical protein SteCoe_4906 [Stentor coeruleus]
MKFIELTNSNFLEIIKYLELTDFAQLFVTCKFFLYFFKRNEDFMQNLALSLLGIKYSPSIYPWKSILLNLYNSSDTQLQNVFHPFYTNGGTYGDLGGYFIWKLTQDEGTHCTVLGENALIKYIFSPNISVNLSEQPIEYKVSENVFYLAYIEEKANCQKYLFAKIEKIFIKIPTVGFTCPCEILMCFSSFEKIEDLSLIQNFYSCKTKEDTIRSAEILDLKMKVIQGKEYESVIFKKTLREIQPLCWVKVNYEKYSSNGFFIDIDQTFLSKYFYVLLISKGKPYKPNKNIDISNVTPLSRVIEIGN